MLASSFSTPTIGKVLGWSFIGLLILDTPFSPSRLFKSFQISVLVAYTALYGLANFWLGHVTKNVRGPYLDEVFHIPQAQAYCQGRYDVWDPKLTTPPGLYIFASAYAKAVAYGKCTPSVLRSFNVFALIMVFAYASDCRALLSRTRQRAPRVDAANSTFQTHIWSDGSKRLSPSEIHTALNIALFPLLFFFSSLFYTDILSTCLVLRMYRLFLERKWACNNSGEGLVWLYLTGVVALWMRQTNIFWVAVFMGGLELVRTIEANQTLSPDTEVAPHSGKEISISYYSRCRRGKIHDISLKNAGLHASLLNPLLIVNRLWPYIGLLITFAGFVFLFAWSEYSLTILGDKENHVATIHLTQMLYIWPLMTFFSAPIIVPYLLAAIYSAVALAVALVVVHFNTIIHPFTLADNRHYMFYVFRYTILRHPSIRYLAVPVYLICGYFVYLALSSEPESSQPITLKKNVSDHVNEPALELIGEPEGPKTSFVIIIIATTTLSLVTAPLVEPRYFIVPWVIWRLNVPSSRPCKSPPKRNSRGNGQGPYQSLLSWIKFWGWEGHDSRLWLETGWLLLINLVTGYMFLYKGFEWKQEPGHVQRFMW
ncbi:putative alpha-1,2 glucosyltransferase alg10 [Diplocarpon rosae]|nr:putative alpha-1,2 glucosyltransferase alg10 [Diplocarpon rosae]